MILLLETLLVYAATEKVHTLYVVEFQWLEHLWDYIKVFETGVFRANEY